MSGFARRVLGEAGAVKADEAAAVGRGALAPATAPDVGDLFGDPILGGIDQGFTGTTGWWTWRRLFDAALGKLSASGNLGIEDRTEDD